MTGWFLEGPRERSDQTERRGRQSGRRVAGAGRPRRGPPRRVGPGPNRALRPRHSLVGSCARGTPGPDSDVDLVILCAEPDDLCRRGDWFTHFGSVASVGQRQFGDVTERRLRRGDGVDIEIGLAPLSWADTDPVDAGTARVVRDGFSIVFDPHGTLAGLAEVVELIESAGSATDVRDNK